MSRRAPRRVRSGASPDPGAGSAQPLPPGLRIAADRRLRRGEDGILIGGSPRRVMRLSADGVGALEALQRGGATDPAARALGRRLLDAGVAHPRPAGHRDISEVTIVVPARDRSGELERCLDALGPAVPVIVVDDGSRDPGSLRAIAERSGATLVVRRATGGPAAARNTGLARARTDLVAFVDSDCVPRGDWLSALVGHFDDPLVAAVAPRVRPYPDRRSRPPMEPEPRPPPERRGAVLRRYLAARSPLDMGPAEASVQADGRVRYLPSAALVVRRAALGAGFDEALRHGEDVDLLWRLRDAGWRIRYDPSAIVEHHEPRTLGAVLARRFRYGTSAGPLARRHPRGLAPARIEPRRALIALLLVRGRPGPAGVVGLIELGSLLRRTRGLGVPSRWTARWIAESTGQTILSLARYLAGFALPIVLAAAWRARDPRPVLFVCLPALQEWALRETELDPVRWTALALADEVAYGAGVVVGSIRSRTIRPLIPRFG